MHLMVVTDRSDRSEVRIYRSFVKEGIRVSMICSPTEPHAARLAEGGVNVIKMQIKHRLDFGAVQKVRSILGDLQPELIYAPRNGSLSVSLLASYRLPVKIVAYRGTMGHLSRLDPASWLTYLNHRVAHIVCVSHAVREYLVGMGIPPERLTTIHKGHDVAWYKPGERNSLSEFGIPESAFVLGFTGNMRPVKGVDVLLESLRHVSRDLNVHLLLVGEIRDRRIMAVAGSEAMRHHVHLSGFRLDATALAGACDAFVMPSVEREGLPRSVIEAMAQCVPPIVSDVGGMPELVVDGECGLVVPPSDPIALANAISSLAANSSYAARLGQMARERIIAKFNINTTTHDMKELFQKVCLEN